MNNFMFNYEVSEGVIVDDEGEQFANGVFGAKNHMKIRSGREETHVIVAEFTTVSNGKENNTVVEIPLNELKTSKLSRYIPSDFIFYMGTEKFQEKFIRNKIFQDIKDMPVEEVYLLKQGHNVAGSRHIFCLGNCIVNPVDSPGLTYRTLSDKNLKTYSGGESYMHWIDKFYNLDKDIMPSLLLSVISAVIIPLLKEAGIDNMFVAYIYGETGKGKSTYSKLLTEVYDNTNNHLTLSSDITGIREMMVQIKDFVMLADDLNLSGSSRVKASKESKISEIIQQAANGDLVKYKGEESYFEGLLFVTAEYVLKNESTNNRCILLEIKEQMNTETVGYLKENQGMYVEFLKDFIRYVYDGFEQNVKRIKDLSAVISVKKSNCRDAYAGITRIERTEKILMIALGILEDFFRTKLKLTDDIIKNYNKIFVNSIRNCIDVTKEYVRKENAVTGREYIDNIIYLIEESIGYDYKIDKYIAKSYEKYKKKRKNREKCYFFAYNGCLCFRGDDIENYFKNLYDFEYSVSKKAISSQLKYYGLLKTKGGEYSFPCQADNSNTRYYHIYIENLAHFMYPEPDEFVLRDGFINSLK